MEFDGKTAIVTGGASGIGAAIARSFVLEGAQVGVVDINSENADKQAATLNDLRNAAATPVSADLRDPGQAARLVAQLLAQWGRLDVLVNCAGVLRPSQFEELALADWQDSIAVNLTGPMVLSQNAVRHMLTRQKGVIVNVSSIAGDLALPGMTSYSVAKAGLQMLTKSMAVEYGSRGIRVNAVAPHAIETPATEEVFNSSAGDGLRAGIPMGRFGQAQEVADVVCYLASERASFVNGAILAVNGGASARAPGDLSRQQGSPRRC